MKYKTLQAYLEGEGISQREFAKKIGVSQRTITKLVHRQVATYGKIAIQIHIITGVPFESLITKEEKTA